MHYIAFLVSFFQPFSPEAFASYQRMMDHLWFLLGGFKTFCWTLAVAVSKDLENGGKEVEF